MRFFAIWFALLLSVAWPSSANAFSISPLRLRSTIDPGKEQIVALTITNTEKNYANYSIRVGGVKQDVLGRPVFGDNFDVAEKWITSPSTIYRLAPSATKKVFFTITVPAGTEPGTHTSALIVEKNAPTEQTVGLATQAAVLLTIDVSGVVHEGVNIESWQAKYQADQKQLVTHIVIKNTGTVSVPVQAKVVITSPLGKEIASAPLPMGTIVLPGTRREVSPAIPLILQGGAYKAVVRVTYGLSGAETTANVTMWSIPVWVYLGAIGLVVFVGLFIQFFKKKK